MSIFKENRDENQDINSVLFVLSTLFFMWGLITVLNLTLVDNLMTIFELTGPQANLINLTFFGTYFVISLPAGKLISRIGFRKGMLAGLITSAVGCFLFYEAADLRSYSLFLFAQFLVAAGITILQTGANPYVVLVGQRGLGASRLTLVQAFNSLGTFLAPLFATGLFMNLAGLTPDSFGTMSPDELKAALVSYVKTPYLFLGAALIFVALFVTFSKLPKLHLKSQDPLIKETATPRKWMVEYPHVALGALAIFFYVGCEVAIAQYIGLKADTIGFSSDALVKFYWGAAMIGRFIGAGLLTKISPRKHITFAALISAILVAASIGVGGAAGIYMLIAIGLFNSVLFPCIFSMGIDGLGRHTESGAALLIMAIVGGAIIPLVFWRLEASVISFTILIFGYLFISFFGFRGSRYEKRTNFY